MKDVIAGEVPVAFIVKSNGSNITEEEIKQFIAKQVKKKNVPHKNLASKTKQGTHPQFSTTCFDFHQPSIGVH